MRLSRRITVTWRRADELAVLLARAITRRFVVVAAGIWLPAPTGCLDRAHAERSTAMRVDDVGRCLQ
jgi:hypothetical protein